MRVMVVANCARFTSLTVSEAAVNVVKLLKDMLNLVPFGTAVPLLGLFYLIMLFIFSENNHNLSDSKPLTIYIPSLDTQSCFYRPAQPLFSDDPIPTVLHWLYSNRGHPA